MSICPQVSYLCESDRSIIPPRAVAPTLRPEGILIRGDFDMTGSAVLNASVGRAPSQGRYWVQGASSRLVCSFFWRLRCLDVILPTPRGFSCCSPFVSSFLAWAEIISVLLKVPHATVSRTNLPRSAPVQRWWLGDGSAGTGRRRCAHSMIFGDLNQ